MARRSRKGSERAVKGLSRLPFADRYPTATHPCPACKMVRPPSGHDPCIADLPGVQNACCGHGGEGYIQFTDGRIVRCRFKSVYKPKEG
jgi:hypothetical protein